ncbi:hypothetical protein IEQ34_006296 [Dendrobium chrysotoxum]|uniref:Uncharacterized protein n=1 Tax=Dendrobium chrysotoxum TaxID=161865 RepID=A0AAV7HF05_DENCH|nr:hypothetical protein IEQ34_006296 [Dendrobium chrysotoxum]
MRRWALPVLVAFLLLLSSICPQSFSREIAGKFFQSKARSNMKRSKSKRHYELCNCLVGYQKEKNSSCYADDKRPVPTGSNPLHNR